MIALASSHTAAATSFVIKLNDIIVFPLIMLLLGIAVLVFLWGLFQLVANAGSDDARSTGKRHMLYGIIGIVVMVSALGILNIALGTFGLPAAS